MVDTDADLGSAGFTSLKDAAAAIADCTRCPLYRFATQAVFGEGPARARLMMVGEQPGDQEDLQGRPFVGPAGRELDRAIEAAGIDRKRVYVTNAVKHFKFTPRGKRRIHGKPNAGEIRACRFWLAVERQLVRPKVVVALGATAVRSLMGSGHTLRSLRGQPLELRGGGTLVVTIHPSFLLRMPDREQAALERERFVDDLREASRLAKR
jgi:DNA polymerase